MMLEGVLVVQLSRQSLKHVFTIDAKELRFCKETEITTIYLNVG